LDFGTKNLPDAMEWHCSYFWSHALKINQVKRSKKSYNLLRNSIAIPILKKKSVSQYVQLGKKLLQYV
jgi:8-amino-3,8-dideoxy-alpha-D-manno-octulosonate transaminase